MVKKRQKRESKYINIIVYLYLYIYKQTTGNDKEQISLLFIIINYFCYLFTTKDKSEPIKPKTRLREIEPRRLARIKDWCQST